MLQNYILIQTVIFPNHHPNPSDESTLNDLKQKVVEVNADIGIAFDGDSDRIGIVLPTGESITGDKLLLIYSLDVIEDLVKTWRETSCSIRSKMFSSTL